MLDYQQWKIDCIRLDDTVKMNELIRKLGKCRKAEPKLSSSVYNNNRMTPTVNKSGIGNF